MLTVFDQRFETCSVIWHTMLSSYLPSLASLPPPSGSIHPSIHAPPPSLCSELFNCTQLLDLNLYNNGILSVPSEMRQIRRIKYLNLASNKLVQLSRCSWGRYACRLCVRVHWCVCAGVCTHAHPSACTRLKCVLDFPTASGVTHPFLGMSSHAVEPSPRPCVRV